MLLNTKHLKLLAFTLIGISMIAMISVVVVTMYTQNNNPLAYKYSTKISKTSTKPFTDIGNPTNDLDLLSTENFNDEESDLDLIQAPNIINDPNLDTFGEGYIYQEEEQSSSSSSASSKKSSSSISTSSSISSSLESSSTSSSFSVSSVSSSTSSSSVSSSIPPVDPVVLPNALE
jgi:hypothetical protein